MSDVPAAAAAPAKAIKRVPKWAWIAGAGVAGGVIFYKFTHKSQVDNASTGDATAPADYGQTTADLGSGIVTSPGGGGYYSDSAPAAGGLQISDVTDLLDSISNARAVDQQNAPQPIGAVDLLNAVLPYVGGGAPQSQTTQQQPQTQPKAPTAPAPAAPVKDRCTGSFPFDAGNGDCYRVQCNPPGHAKGRYHFHKNGQVARVASSC